MGDFAEIWQAADKVVYSNPLTDVSTRRTRIERPLPDGVRLELELLDQRRFAGGVVYLNYRAKRPARDPG